MAQYRLSAQVVKRSDGRSAVAAAAYRAGERLIDRRLEMAFDYTRRGGVEHSEIMLPAGAPERFADRSTLWNAVEAAERRSDAQVAREVQVSLPHELDFAQRQALLREFVETNFTAKGMIADVAMHTPDAHGDDRNFHAHILLTTRGLEGDEFGAKIRDWNRRETLQEWRASWADIQNWHLAQALGDDAPTVTHLSLADRFIDREATVHLGPKASAIERKGERSDRGDINRAVAADNDRRASASRTIRGADDARTAAGDHVPTSPQGLADELKALQGDMVRVRATWQAERAAIAMPKVVKASEVRSEILGPARRERAAAMHRLKRTEDRVAAIGAKRTSLSSFIANPARAVWAKIKEVHALDRAKAELKRARLGVQVREQWLRSAAGQAYVLDKVDRSLAAAQPARTMARTLDRKIARLDKRIEVVGKVRVKAAVAHELGVAAVARPVAPANPTQLIRAVDNQLMQLLGGFAPARRQQAMEAVASRDRGRGMGR